MSGLRALRLAALLLPLLTSTAAAQGPGSAPLPQPAEVLDLSAARAALESFRAGTGQTGVLVLSVHYDSEGAVTHVRPVRSELDDAARDSVIALLREFLVPRTFERGSQAGRYFRLVLNTQDVITFEVQRSQSAPPRLINERFVRQLLMQGAGANMRGLVRVMVRVTVDGRPGGVRVEESSGDRAMDALAVRVARQMRFEPAHIDGYPLEVWTLLPLSIDSRRPPEHAAR